ncbi:MAG: T9SS type A sorting domain-containing protein, partial [Ignavibacteriae bacterium]|nr:T9SS type A sorting domain-containing protein [Ignavibacteriota bacterium]
ALRPSARRVIISSKNKDESLSFELDSPVMENASDSLLSFVPVIDTVRYTAQSVWSLFETPSFTIRNSDLPLRIKHSVRGWRSRGNRNPILNIPAVLEVVHAGTNSVLSQQTIDPVLSDSGTTVHGIGRLRPAITGATPVKFRLRLNRTFPHQHFNAAVVNVFRVDTSSQALLKQSITAVAKETPTQFALHPNYPNPFNPTTQIKFDLPEASHITLAVYDVLGRKVAELVNGQVVEGYHTATWNAGSVASGVYFARFTATDATGAVKLAKVMKLLFAK